MYEECPPQNSLSQQSPLEAECENTRAASVLFKDEESMDGNRSLFSKGT